MENPQTWQPSSTRAQIPTDAPPIPAPRSEPGSSGSGDRGRRTVDEGFATLRRSPLRRDSSNGIVGGVCAGIAEATGLSVVAVRAAAVVLALFFGAGLGAYLLAWAALPDQHGTTHAEQALRGGRPRSMVVLVLGGFAFLGVLSWILDSALLPILIAVGVVAYVVTKKKRSSLQ